MAEVLDLHVHITLYSTNSFKKKTVNFSESAKRVPVGPLFRSKSKNTSFFTSSLRRCVSQISFRLHFFNRIGIALICYWLYPKYYLKEKSSGVKIIALLKIDASTINYTSKIDVELVVFTYWLCISLSPFDYNLKSQRQKEGFVHRTYFVQ